jgi:hypothetical protein
MTALHISAKLPLANENERLPSSGYGGSGVGVKGVGVGFAELLDKR